MDVENVIHVHNGIFIQLLRKIKFPGKSMGGKQQFYIREPRLRNINNVNIFSHF